MRKVYEYSHLGGLEILRVRYPTIEREIDEVIAEVKAPKTKISKEKGKAGKLLYNPAEMNSAFKPRSCAKSFVQGGFSTRRRAGKPCLDGVWKVFGGRMEGIHKAGLAFGTSHQISISDSCRKWV